MAPLGWLLLWLLLVRLCAISHGDGWFDPGADRCLKVFANSRGQYFQYGHAYRQKIDFHYACRDQGMAFELVSFQLKLDSYLTRLSASRPDAARRFAAVVDVESLRHGVLLCVPVKQCLEDFEERTGQPRRGFLWWRDQNLTQSGVSRFWCTTLIPVFLSLAFGVQPDDLIHVFPGPRPQECNAQMTDVGATWQDNLEVLLGRRSSGPTAPMPWREAWKDATTGHAAAARTGKGPPGPLQLQPAASLAICISGQLRTFEHPEVHESIRDHAVRSLNASLTRIFFVLNLESVNQTLEKEPKRHSATLVDVLPTIVALGDDNLIASLVVEPQVPRPPLRDGLAYSSCYFDQAPCPMSWSGKVLCEANIKDYEAAYDVSFDWVLEMRPDLRLNFPLGDIRRFESGHVHTSFYSWTEMSDRLNLIPRAAMPTYVSAFAQPRRTEEERGRQRYVCMTDAEVAEAIQAGACQYGSCGCLLQQHLQKHSVPLRRMPREIFTVVRLPGVQ